MTEPYQAVPGEDPVPQRAIQPDAEPVPQRAEEQYLPEASFATPARAEDFAPYTTADAPVEMSYRAPQQSVAPAQDIPPAALYSAPDQQYGPADPTAPLAPPAAHDRAPDQQYAPFPPLAPQDQGAALYRAPEQRLAPAPDQAPVQHLAPATNEGTAEAPGARRAAPLADEPEDVVSFPGAVGWTIAGTVIPGIGFLKARRWFDGVMTLVFFVFVLAIVGYLVYEPAFAKALMTSPITLLGIAVLCAILGIMIIGIIIATYHALRPHVVTSGQRIGGAVLVFALSFLVCLPLAVGAGYTLSQAGLIK